MEQPRRSYIDKNPGTPGVSNLFNTFPDLYLGFSLFPSPFLAHESVILCQFVLAYFPFFRFIRLCYESQDKSRRDLLKQVKHNVLKKDIQLVKKLF